MNSDLERIESKIHIAGRKLDKCTYFIYTARILALASSSLSRFVLPYDIGWAMIEAAQLWN